MTDYFTSHPHYLFVYGTLKQPFGNHGVLQRHGARFISAAHTMDRFTLTESFPFVWRPLESAPAAYREYLGQIVGELYKVSDAGLEACDRLEGHPNFYCRTPITVTFGPTPTHVTAGIYLDPSSPPDVTRLQRPVNGKLEWGVKYNPVLEASHPQFIRRNTKYGN